MRIAEKATDFAIASIRVPEGELEEAWRALDIVDHPKIATVNVVHRTRTVESRGVRQIERLRCKVQALMLANPEGLP